MSIIKTRFCPSPTGSMHLGNLRTALFSALFARSKNGKFLLRIEDTDQNRSEQHYTQAIEDDLHWFGIDWQEGPDKDGGNGPYYQSKRDAIYEHYYQSLIKAGIAYPCFCSEKQLAMTRKSQLAAGKPPRYPGTCKSLTRSEIDAKIAQGERPVLRFKIPAKTIIEFVDVVKGLQHFNSSDIGDFIIRRHDNTPSFMFCNAIDDSLMGVTHVIRGEDHLTNTPRQIMILEALGLTVPQYGHMSLILGDDGAPLGKRHGSSSVDDLRKEGILPSALLNYLSRLGHYYPDNNFLDFDGLAGKFSLESLSKSAAKFDPIQLSYWQKIAIDNLADDELWQWMGVKVHQLVWADAQEKFIQTIKGNVLSPKDSICWAQIIFGKMAPFNPENKQIILTAGVDYFKCALKTVDEVDDDYNKFCQLMMAALKIKGKAFYQPLRIALTGEAKGPKLADLFGLLGSTRLKQRFDAALKIFN